VSTVLIAGVEQGAGDGIAAAFAQAGWTVVTDRDHPDAEPGALLSVAGPVSAVVANAAFRHFLPGSPEPDPAAVTADAAAMLALAEMAPDHMPEGGAVLFVTGTAHFLGAGAPPAAAAAKGSLVGAARALAVRHGPRGVRVNILTVGLVRTPAVEAHLAAMGEHDHAAFEALVVERTPMRRMGRPEDVGAMCAFLVSDRAKAITGVEVVVDGGLLQLNKTFSYNPPARGER
jgi:2-hydroxycyclohexanecarboxyl-CoA dehydrogenase